MRPLGKVRFFHAKRGSSGSDNPSSLSLVDGVLCCWSFGPVSHGPGPVQWGRESTYPIIAMSAFPRNLRFEAAKSSRQAFGSGRRYDIWGTFLPLVLAK